MYHKSSRLKENTVETKWFTIMIVGTMLAIFGAGAVTEYGKYQCRIEAVKALQDPDKIKELCSWSWHCIALDLAAVL